MRHKAHFGKMITEVIIRLKLLMSRGQPFEESVNALSEKEEIMRKSKLRPG